MSKVIPLRPAALPRIHPDAILRAIDATLCQREESLSLWRPRLARLTGRDRVAVERLCAELEDEVAFYRRERLRVAGPELCLLPGGRR